MPRFRGTPRGRSRSGTGIPARCTCGGRGGAARDRGRRVPSEPGLAVQGLPVPQPVLGVAVKREANHRLQWVCERSYHRVVDLKTSARKYANLHGDALLQLSLYRYATAMNGLADLPREKYQSDSVSRTSRARDSKASFTSRSESVVVRGSGESPEDPLGNTRSFDSRRSRSGPDWTCAWTSPCESIRQPRRTHGRPSASCLLICA